MLLVNFLTVATAALQLQKRTDIPAFDYQNEKVRGVNLGGWFVLEPFITPSMFEIFGGDEIPIDEYHYCEKLGKEQAASNLEGHWDSWITEDDFRQISEWGFNTVRIGLGYWAFIDRPQDPYVQGQIKYLDRALGWARTHNIKVWVDLHGVPGSQNGFDNSGSAWVLNWQNDEFPENIKDTYYVLDQIASKYGTDEWLDVVSGIELVNEPNSATFGDGLPKLDLDKLKDYYYGGYGTVRNYGPNGVIIHDAFQQPGYFNEWLQVPDYWNVVLDHHHYQVFSTGELERSFDDQIKVACDTGRSYGVENLWKVCGEWSAALTDCTPWLHGVYTGARYDNTWNTTSYIGSCEGINNFATWTDERKEQTRRYIEAQLDAFEMGGGWIFWTYRTEDTIEWDMRTLISLGLFPQPLTDRKYPGQCN